MKKLYDLTYWLKANSNINEEEEKILNLLKKFDVDIIYTIAPRKRNFAYRINDEIYGFLGSIFFNTTAKEIIAINQALKEIKSILRFLIIKRKTLPLAIQKLITRESSSVDQDKNLVLNESQ